MRRASGLGGACLALWMGCVATSTWAQPPLEAVTEAPSHAALSPLPSPVAPVAAPMEPGPDATVKERQAYWYKALLAPAVPPPGLARKPSLTDRDRRNKRSQKPFAVIGVPQMGGNPDHGFILGAVTALTWYGEPKQEPFYDYSAYRHQIIAQVQVGLRKQPDVLGRQNYILRYAAPYLHRSLFSFAADASYEADVSAWYFGSDARTMGALRSIGPDDSRFQRRFATYNAYQSELRQVVRDSDGERDGERVSYATYHNFKFRQPRLMSSLKVDLFGGIVTPALTASIAYVDVERYGGERVRGARGTARSLPTKLDEDCAAGLVTRCNGAWNNTLKFSVALDLRDFPVDANRGVLIDLSVETAKKFFGSPDYDRFTLSTSGFYNPFLAAGIDTRWTQLVLAARVLYSVQQGDTPFFVRNQLAFIDRNVGGLGGINTMRGYRANRFVGDVVALGNFELRYDFYSFNTKRSTISFKLVPFVDAGRVFDRVTDTTLEGFRADVGSGLHLQWNQTNVIRADVGVGDEGASFGVNYGMLF